MAIGLILAMIITSIAALPVFAAEADEPITTITSAEDLKTFADTVNSGTDYRNTTVSVTNNITLTGEWTPIGTSAHPFRGTFDGGSESGYTISDLKISGESNSNDQGLFGVVNYGTLQNVTVNNANVSGGASVAAIVGSIIGTVDNCDLTGESTITGNHYVGGVAGYSYANYSNCDIENVTVTVTGDGLETGDKGGALAGFMGEGTYTVLKCTATNITVSALRDAGGLVGCATGNLDYNTVKFEECTVDGNVTATGFNSEFLGVMATAGGIVGRALADASFVNCAFTGTVTAPDDNRYGGIMCGYSAATGGPVDVSETSPTPTPEITK